MTPRLRGHRLTYTPCEAAAILGMTVGALAKARQRGNIAAINLNADKPGRQKPRYRFAARALREYERR